MKPRGRPASTLLLLLCLCAPPSTALAQEPGPAVPAVDSTQVAPSPQPPPAPSPPPRIRSTFRRTGEEVDRFEIGGAVVRGFFDAVGTLGYRRFLGANRTLERNLMGELSGSTKDQLSEGVLSVYWFLRPEATYRQSWRIRPLIEIGPGVHTVLQVASLEGLNKSRYKAHVYIKTHAYAGFEALLTNRFGILVRGRMSVPSHRPMDYAQAAIFLR